MWQEWCSQHGPSEIYKHIYIIDYLKYYLEIHLYYKHPFLEFYWKLQINYPVFSILSKLTSWLSCKLYKHYIQRYTKMKYIKLQFIKVFMLSNWWENNWDYWMTCIYLFTRLNKINLSYLPLLQRIVTAYVWGQ